MHINAKVVKRALGFWQLVLPVFGAATIVGCAQMEGNMKCTGQICSTDPTASVAHRNAGEDFEVFSFDLEEISGTIYLGNGVKEPPYGGEKIGADWMIYSDGGGFRAFKRTGREWPSQIVIDSGPGTNGSRFRRFVQTVRLAPD